MMIGNPIAAKVNLRVEQDRTDRLSNSECGAKSDEFQCHKEIDGFQSTRFQRVIICDGGFITQ